MRLTSQKTNYVALVTRDHFEGTVCLMFELALNFAKKLSNSNKAFEENLYRSHKQDSDDRIRVLKVPLSELPDVFKDLDASVERQVSYLEANKQEWLELSEKFYYPSADVISFIDKLFITEIDSLHDHRLRLVDLTSDNPNKKEPTMWLYGRS